MNGSLSTREPMLLAFHACTEPRAAAICSMGCQVAHQLKLRCLFHSTFNQLQILLRSSRNSVQVTFWEIHICLGRSKILDKYDLPNLRASLFMSKNRTAKFHYNCQWLKHIQDNRRISVTFGCLWAQRPHLQHLAVFTTYCKIRCNGDKLPTKP